MVKTFSTRVEAVAFVAKYASDVARVTSENFGEDYRALPLTSELIAVGPFVGPSEVIFVVVPFAKGFAIRVYFAVGLSFDLTEDAAGDPAFDFFGA